MAPARNNNARILGNFWGPGCIERCVKAMSPNEVSPTEIALSPGPELSDDELLRGCQRRDDNAVRELTRRYNRRLFRITRGILRDDAAAEDVVQETYVRVFTHLEQFRGDSSVGTWLVRIAMNLALGRIRSRLGAAMEWCSVLGQATGHLP